MAHIESLKRIYTGQIRSAKELYDWMKSRNDIKIDVDFCTVQDYEDTESELRNKFINVKTIRGTRKYHAIIPDSDSALFCKTFSFSASIDHFSLV